MGIFKNGIVTTGELYDQEGMNYLDPTFLKTVYTYAPTTGSNSTYGAYQVDLSNCTAGEAVCISIDVEWNGFDESNTTGTFNLRWQGNHYVVANAAWEWVGTNTICNALNNAQNLKTLVLSATSGHKTIIASAVLPSAYPATYSKARVSVRSDYSNGTGTLTFSNLKVIPAKYYAGFTVPGQVKIAEDYIATNEFIEM